MHSRLFLGVSLPTELRDNVLSACELVRENDQAWRDAKWVGQSNLHLTLVFIGDLDEDELPRLSDEFDVLAESHRPFSLPPAAIRAVPSANRCRMIWSEFRDPGGSCESLAHDLAGVMGLDTRPGEDRVFRAHVTLCRARRPRPIESTALEAANGVFRAVPTPMSVPAFTLFESQLTPSGAVYTQRGTWDLRAG